MPHDIHRATAFSLFYTYIHIITKYTHPTATSTTLFVDKIIILKNFHYKKPPLMNIRTKNLFSPMIWDVIIFKSNCCSTYYACCPYWNVTYIIIFNIIALNTKVIFTSTAFF